MSTLHERNTTPDAVATARAALVAGTGTAPETWTSLWAAYWAARGQIAPPAEAPWNWHEWQEPAAQDAEVAA